MLLVGFKAYGQVGVNTESPQGVFHIDAQKNTNGNTNIADDIVVKANGNVGIGTNDPQTKVDIRSTTQGGGFRLQDGTQGTNRTLTSDANGNASWKPQAIRSIVRPNQNVGNTLSNKYSSLGKGLSAGATEYVGVSITLPAGTWQISYNATFTISNPTPASLLWSLSKSGTTLNAANTVGQVMSGSVPTNGYHSPVAGVFLVTHTTTTNYYVWVKNLGGTAFYTGEGQMWALPIN
ncbi:hypothetical protein D0T56_08115 [Dysgonomonas sp. 520]|nr:hypothetical protein [Dysgonomonas sp. 520]